MCTSIRFSDSDGHAYLARNLDWTNGYGEGVVITPTGLVPRSPFGAIHDVEHAVIGMAIVEEDVPLYYDCGNDTGLAVAGLNFPGYAQYAPGPQEGATNVAAFEFPLWLTSQFTTVDEVQAALRSVVIVDRPINERFPNAMLHWIVADDDRSIVVEQTAHGMQVFDDDVDVLTNQPGFAWHHENLRNYLNVAPGFPAEQALGGARLSPFGSGSQMRGLPGDYYSPSRFVRAAYVNAHSRRRPRRRRTSAAPSTRSSRSRWSRELQRWSRASSRRRSTRACSRPARRRTTGTRTTILRSEAHRSGTMRRRGPIW